MISPVHLAKLIEAYQARQTEQTATVTELAATDASTDHASRAA